MRIAERGDVLNVYGLTSEVDVRKEDSVLYEGFRDDSTRPVGLERDCRVVEGPDNEVGEGDEWGGI